MISYHPVKPERLSQNKLDAIKRALDRYEYGEDSGRITPIMADAYSESEIEKQIPALVSALAVSRVLIPVFPHQMELKKNGEMEPCQEGQLHSRLLSLPGSHINVAEVYSDLDRLRKYQPEARPVPVSARSFAALAYNNPGRAILDDQVFLPRTALAAIATAANWLPSWQNDALLQKIRGLGADLEKVTPIEIKPQYCGPDILLVAVPDKSPDTVVEIGQLQKRIFQMLGIGEQVDMLMVVPTTVGYEKSLS